MCLLNLKSGGNNKVDRNNDIEEYLKEYRSERLEQKRTYLTNNMCKIEPEFYKKLNLLISQQLTRQKNDAVAKLNYIYLCHLKSSDYTESYRAILGFSNSMLYLDEKKSQSYWYPELIYKNISEDMNTIEKIVRNKFVRLEKFELLTIKHKILNDDWILFQECFKTLINQSISIIFNSSLRLADEILLLCGDYMDNLSIVGHLNTEGRLE